MRLACALVVLVGASAACRSRETMSSAVTTQAEPDAGEAESAASVSAAPLTDADARDAGAPEVDADSPDANTEGWCTDGLTAIDPETCVVIPETIRPPRALLIYLHGTIDPRGKTQAFVQGVVARSARARGYVAMVPRGKRGIGPNAIADWWAWPTTAGAHARYAKSMTAGWLERRAKLEALLGAAFEKTYLAGSSNGAYFLSVLALKGEFAADGFGALSGGSRGSWTKQTIAAPPAARPPFYVGYGVHDDTKPDPISLGQLLQEAGWPHRVAAHRVSHGANDVYLDEALPYWGGP